MKLFGAQWPSGHKPFAGDYEASTQQCLALVGTHLLAYGDAFVLGVWRLVKLKQRSNIPGIR